MSKTREIFNLIEENEKLKEENEKLKNDIKMLMEGDSLLADRILKQLGQTVYDDIVDLCAEIAKELKK